MKIPMATWKKKLKSLVQYRNKIARKRAVWDEEWKKVNTEILAILEKQKKRAVSLSGIGQISRVQVKKVEWDEDAIFKWYKKKRPNLKPPVRIAFDPEKLEKDIKAGLVPAKMLEEWADIKKQDPYVRLDA